MVEALRHPALRASSAKHLESLGFRAKNSQDEAWYLIGLGESDRALSSSEIGLQTMLSALDQLLRMPLDLQIGVPKCDLFCGHS